MGKEKIKKSLQHIKDQHGDIYNAYKDFSKLVQTEGGTLDAKTLSLIQIALTAANRNHETFRAHLYKALEMGCGLREIEHAVFMTATVVGFPTMLEAHAIFREVADEKSPMKDVALDSLITH